MPRNPNTPRLARWISRFHLGTPFKLRSTFSLSLSPPFLSSSHVTLSVVRGCPSEPFKFRTRLLLSRCHFISWTMWTKIHGRKYPPPSSLHNTPPDIANYFAFISSFSLSLLSPLQSLNSRLVGRRKEFTSFARGRRGEK